MTKEEVIKRIEKMGEYEYFVAKKSVIAIITQINEPQKVVIPKFVAEWIEKHKNNNGKKDRLSHALEHVFDEVELGLYIKQQEGDYTETIAKAWIDGYTIEKEKLYTVEILDILFNLIVLSGMIGLLITIWAIIIGMIHMFF